MASEISTIQSLKAVDAWIDVINANINGGVRTAFKSSRLKFSGSNVDVSRAGNTTSLPLQFPEPGLTTANTVIDFTQGAITASTENTHLAIQGTPFFLLINPQCVAADGSLVNPDTVSKVTFLLTRDGEFHTNQSGLLVHSTGYFPLSINTFVGGAPMYSNASFGAASMRTIYNDLDSPSAVGAPARAVRLSDWVPGNLNSGTATDMGGAAVFCNSLMEVVSGRQSLQYSTFGSTVFDFGYRYTPGVGTATYNSALKLNDASDSTYTLLTKSLEASNASMTQSVPELSLAQKLFSALTKVLQTKQTNVDGVLNLVR
jgi:flagellar hook protein FlgE